MTNTAISSDTGPATPRAIFNQDRVCVVDAALIEKLKTEALRSPLGRYRLCMHHSTGDPAQDMVVAHRCGTYTQPHCHPAAATSFAMIEGRLDVLIFDDTGALTRRVRMGRLGDRYADTVSLHLSTGVIHMEDCLTETAVFHETLSAPNQDGGATRYAAWSPPEDDPDRAAAFRRRLGQERQSNESDETLRPRVAADQPSGPGAFFNRDRVCAVDATLIERLKTEALRSPLGRFRLCMHHSTSDPMQDMIIVHRRGNYSRPHYHPNAAMSYTMIEGRMDILLFDDAGSVTERVRMGCHGDPESDAVGIRLAAGTVYTPVCLTEAAVFHETLSAPNPDGEATHYAAWSPADDEPDRIAAFHRGLGIGV
ncbi:MAG: cupin fold metalloprotein, WbuC family [Verrucomicrobia bacterium]|nr:cupin fold metalloprotein, WbuC family [Verrucomicrobiota bacterium]MBT7068237.1 cupin fold metalloprotein, WbuC family [Verrucomicrobiota bacterium]MBT7699627.1 cupin fold metalloprotein, WbuC family [Verrucomicrobiota bacterium]